MTYKQRSDKVDKIKIIVDTASDISIEEAEKYNIELVPINIEIDGKNYRELFDITKEEYWEILLNSESIPKTSQVTPQIFLKTYKKLCDEGYNKIIVVTINASGSGTFNSANLAYSMLKEEYNTDAEFRFVDSGIYTYCYGKPVLDAAKMILEEKSFEDIVSYLENILPKMRGFAYISSLKFAKMSGRISVLSAVVGEALGLKPILDVFNRKVEVVNKARGEKAALSKLIENVRQTADDLENQEIVLVHGHNSPEMIEKIYNEIMDKLNPKSIHIGKLGCSITTNAGPEAIGILYKCK